MKTNGGAAASGRAFRCEAGYGEGMDAPQSPFWIVPADAGRATPLVFASPHSGDLYPDDMGATASARAVRSAEDAAVDQLIDCGPGEGASLIAARVGRVWGFDEATQELRTEQQAHGEAVTALAALREAQGGAVTELDAVRQAHAGVTEELDAVKQAHAGATEELEGLRTAHANATDELDSLRTAHANATDELATLRAAHAEAADGLTTLRHAHAGATEELTAVKQAHVEALEELGAQPGQADVRAVAGTGPRHVHDPPHGRSGAGRAVGRGDVTGEQQHAVGELQGLLHVMGDEQDGGAAGV